MDNSTRSAKPAAKPATPVTPVKGSWEDLLYRGQQLVAMQKPEGGEILQNLINRLSQMPEATLDAGNHRLRNILLEAIRRLAPYLLYHQRFDDVIACLDIGERCDREQPSAAWQTYRAMVLMQSGAVDEGFALLREVTRNGEPEQWMGFVLEAVQRRRLDIAEEGVKEAEHTLNRRSAAAENPDALRRPRAALALAKAHLAAANNKPEEASAWMEYALTQYDGYREKLPAFYLRLVEHGLIAEALKWAQRDQLHPMRSKFWQAYMLYRLNQHAEAERLWGQIARIDIATAENVELFEYIMAHYFRGDREGVGLGITLNILERGEEMSYLILFLAGLGWAIRGDQAAAHANFLHAQLRIQGLALGHKLNAFWWQLCTDLVDEDVLPAYAKYFDVPEPAVH